MASLLNLCATDYGLLLAIALGTRYLCNRGSILPKRDPFRHKFFETPQKQEGAASSSPVGRDIGVKARDAGARFVILWGSQSGTAESISNRLARDIQQRLQAVALVEDLSDYDPCTLSGIPDSAILILVMSTFGEGDPSDNAQEFAAYIAKAASGSLPHLHFAAFGCGNSSYRCFNKVILDAASAVERCGAKLILPVGAGDEATRSTHEDFLEWKERLISALTSEHGFSDHGAHYQPTVFITAAESSPDLQQERNATSGWGKAVYLPIISRKVIASYEDEKRTCIDLKMDISSLSQIKYRTGDHIAIWPENPTDEVDRLLRVLGQESNRSQQLHIKSADQVSQPKVPSSTTLNALFLQHLDICAPVPRQTVLALAQQTNSSKISNQLRTIGDSRNSYSNFLEHNYITMARLMELMNAFDPENSWESVPLSFIVDFTPAMKPRLYSISTSCIVEPRQVGIVVSVKPGVVTKCPGTAIPGVASTHLSTAPLGAPGIKSDTPLVRAEIRRSTFRLPFSPKTPVIMVAAGTGTAPFRAFIQERARLASIGRDVGDTFLFFGCQNESDCLFSDEFREIASKHSASLKLKIMTAFSRPPTDGDGVGGPKAYVQDLIFRRRQEVLDYMLNEDAALYICGSTAMAKAVGDVIQNAACEIRQWTDGEARSWRQSRRKCKLWQEDVWS